MSHIYHRREVLTSLLAGTAAAGLGGLANPALAQDYGDINALTQKDILHQNFSSIKSYSHIGVMNYQLGLVVQSGISASAGSGNASTQASVELTGLTLGQMQQIAQRAQDDFVAQITQLGRPMLTQAQMEGTAAFKELVPSALPFRKRPAADPRTVLVVTPPNQPLYLTAVDSPITDKSPFDQKSAMALHKIGFELDALILIPRIVFDFSHLHGSGHRVGAGSASINIDTGLYAVEQFCGITAYHARNKFAGDGGRAFMLKRLRMGEAGQLVNTAQYDNKDEIGWWNSRVNTGMAIPGEIGPSLSYSISAYQYQVDPALFEAKILAAAQRLNGLYAQTVGRVKTGK